MPGLDIFESGGLDIFGTHWKGVTLDAAVAKGTWTASGTWTLPAFTLGGKLTGGAQEIEGSVFDINGGTMAGVTLDGSLTLNGQVFDAGANDMLVTFAGYNKALVLKSTNAGGIGPVLQFKHHSATPADNDTILHVPASGYNDAAIPVEHRYGDFFIQAVDVSDGLETGKFVMRLANAGTENFTVLTITGAGALDTLTYKVSGTQVVGARVVDARCDDVVDATYGAEEAGVLDALRDAMITHGLIAAA